MEPRLTRTGKQAVAPAPGPGTCPSRRRHRLALSRERRPAAVGRQTRALRSRVPRRPGITKANCGVAYFTALLCLRHLVYPGVASSRNLTVVMKKGGHLPALL